MKVIQINAGFKGSTGTIMLSIAELVRQQGGEAFTFSGVKRMAAPDEHAFFGTWAENLRHRVFSVTTGISGTGSKKGTAELIKELETIKPDVIHLHNLHGWYINIPMLFAYLKKERIKTVWTLHDCWAMTAQCSHFTIEKCEKWKSGCHTCPRYRIYPYTFVDRTEKMWGLKKEWLTGVQNMTIVTPSQWLADLVKQSFLKDYPVKVIHNGIDLEVFKPTDSDFREKYGIPEEKSILLGVAFGWGVRKGLDVFVELAKRLDSEKYQIVLVGTDEKVDQQIPENIISIHRTSDQQELAQIYTAANLFVNPTREDNYPTVNMEALACGTPVLTFRTGGSPEIIDETCGCVVDCDDVDAMERQIFRICSGKPYTKEDCLSRAAGVDMNQCFEEYIELYQE